MSTRLKLRKLANLVKAVAQQPLLNRKLLGNLPFQVRGFNYSRHWQNGNGAGNPTRVSDEIPASAPAPNPLKAFLDSHHTGRGVWKWNHYLDIYHHHFKKFIGRDVHVLEIGVYSGGSLEMWREYFGPKCHIYGVDIEEACKCYENEYTKIFIGDQAVPKTWKAFKERVPILDILIDDGGHDPEQQIVPLEEMLPHLRPGGVYLCEDVHGEHNGFSAFMQGVVNEFNGGQSDGKGGAAPTEFQAWIQSIHIYPFVTVLEKANTPMRQFFSPKRGTEWQPFYSR